MPAVNSLPAAGLRDRKKAKRRDEIISVAKKLFAQQGIDATTMADIAAGAEVSPPTVFNYFGSKDGLLIAMIAEGTAEARENDRALHWRDGTDLTTLIITLFRRISSRTLEIASKRVWRYAEAAMIRQPNTKLAEEYKDVSHAVVLVIADFFAELDLTLRSGSSCTAMYLAEMYHDLWMPCFIQLITHDEQTLEQHDAILRERFAPLVELMFTDDCIDTPRRKDPSK
ncbi:TetR/AcrR family transcriptional regulator [Phaeobacter sp. HF9A]|uniref:TetR/AcrR family transcriptional regulator n=1 Tax=Phaeobacter sp. HF9A TaxID=2721561 RepID=UPI001430B6AA|nr:TetR/AcrR family transcriptional regulator [Phaeobacter sp. HF9A]NIZ12634.1 TetR/AcrR family transcriptional regulator [Phaeobacter sp. HF9A]